MNLLLGYASQIKQGLGLGHGFHSNQSSWSKGLCLSYLSVLGRVGQSMQCHHVRLGGFGLALVTLFLVLGDFMFDFSDFVFFAIF